MTLAFEPGYKAFVISVQFKSDQCLGLISNKLEKVVKHKQLILFIIRKVGNTWVKYWSNEKIYFESINHLEKIVYKPNPVEKMFLSKYGSAY